MSKTMPRRNQAWKKNEFIDLRRLVIKPKPASPISIKDQEGAKGVGVRGDAPCGANETPLKLLSAGAVARMPKDSVLTWEASVADSKSVMP